MSLYGHVFEAEKLPRQKLMKLPKRKPAKPIQVSGPKPTIWQRTKVALAKAFPRESIDSLLGALHEGAWSPKTNIPRTIKAM